MQSIEQRIAQDIAAKPEQVRAAVELLDGGATVPFIARYRKEVTGGLDDTQLRLLEERLRYLRELEERREAVLASIAERASSATNSSNRSWMPIPRRDSKICICRTSPSAAPRRRSRAKPDCSHSPTRCVRTSRLPRLSPRLTWTRVRASPTRRPRWTARAPSCSKS